MAVLTWDVVGERRYEAGIDRGVFYPKTGNGVAWNGLVSVSEKSSGGDLKPVYVDGQKVLDVVENEDFQAVITAFSAPTEFLACDGYKSLATGLYIGQQPRVTFGMCYRTLKGSDTLGTDYGYKLHLVYNATVSPSDREYASLSSSSADIGTQKWTVDTVPPASSTYRPAAHMVIDSNLANAAKLTTLMNLLYGTAGTNPGLPTQATVISTLA